MKYSHYKCWLIYLLIIGVYSLNDTTAQTTEMTSISTSPSITSIYSGIYIITNFSSSIDFFSIVLSSFSLPFFSKLRRSELPNRR